MAFDLGTINDPLALQAIEPSITQTTPGEVLGATASETLNSLPLVSQLRQQQRFNESGPDTNLKPAVDPRTASSDVDAMAAERGAAPTRVTLQPDEANAKAKAAGAQVTFDTPIADTTVQSVIDDHLRAQQSADVIARNGSAILAGVLPRFVVGSLLSMLDPVNDLALMIPAAPEAFVAEKLAAAAGVFERTAIRGAAGAVNGAVGMAALEPLNYAMSKSDYNDWSAGDALRNIFMGAALGAGGHMLLGGLAGREHLPTSAEANTSMEATRAAIAQTVADRPVDVAAIPRAAEMTRAADELQSHTTPFVDGIDAFHGTPHEFDRFDTTHIGNGEGSQAFGHGLYFAEERKVADDYRRKLSGPDAGLDALQNQVHDAIAERNKVRASGADTTAINEKLQDLFRQEDAARNANSNGHLYQVKLNTKPEEMLDWDKPLSEQPMQVQGALQSLGLTAEQRQTMTGADLYHKLEDDNRYSHPAYKPGGGGLPPAEWMPPVGGASEALRGAGIKGVRYLDAGSRVNGEGSRNFVMFDHSDVQITHKNGVPVAQAAADLRAQAYTAAKGMAERAMNPPADPAVTQAERINKATIDSAPQIVGDVDKDVAEFTKRLQERVQQLQQEFASGRIIETQEMKDAMKEGDHIENEGKASANYAACLVGKGLK